MIESRSLDSMATHESMDRTPRADDTVKLRAAVVHAESRMAELLEVVGVLAARDYSRRASITTDNDAYDVLALGLNVMAEELQASSGLIHNTLQAMADVLVVAEPEGLIVMANAAAARMLGRTEAALRRRPISTLFGGAAAGMSPLELVRVFGGSGSEATCIGDDGSEVPVSLSAASIFVGGELSGIVCVARDITERQRAEAELKAAKDSLEARVRERTADLAARNAALAEALSDLQRTQEQLIHSEKMASLGLLVAGIAHEIKNPLNFVNNFAPPPPPPRDSHPRSPARRPVPRSSISCRISPITCDGSMSTVGAPTRSSTPCPCMHASRW
jgi:PAS domain S-box-containing protein